MGWLGLDPRTNALKGQRARALPASKTRPRRVATAIALLGKNGKKLIPTLDQMANNMESVETLSASQIRQIEAFNDWWTRLDRSIKAAGWRSPAFVQKTLTTSNTRSRTSCLQISMTVSAPHIGTGNPGAVRASAFLMSFGRNWQRGQYDQCPFSCAPT